MKTMMNDRRSLIGFVFIIIAIFLVLENFDLIPFFLPYYLFSWKMVFILVGLFALSNRENKTPGLILISIGTFFLLPDIFDVHARRLFWPFLLLIIGLSIILRRRGYRDQGRTYSGAEPLTMEYIDEFGIFSGGERVVASQNFRGGRVTSIFGGLKINLLNSTLADGHNMIDVFTIFGGIELVVPASWNVKVDVFALFGGFSDKRRVMTNASLEEQKVLHIKGFVMFGGGDIKSI